MIGNKLTLGDTIGIICPASTEKDIKLMNSKISKFESLGFKVKQGKYMHCNNNDFFSGTDKERAQDFMNMFLDKNIKAIVCYRGGYGSIRILNYVNWDLIRKNPKIFCGYSDITILLNNLNQYTNLITFHSPMINSNFDDNLTRTYFLNVLMHGTQGFSIDLISLPYIKTFNESQVKGRLCGGNLSIICSSLATPYEINTHNKILLLEDVDEKNYSIDRMLTQLLLAKKLQYCKAFLIGQFNPEDNLTQKTILNILKPLNKPIIMNLPIGHSYPNITLPIGAEIYLDFLKGKIKFCENTIE